MNLTLLKNIPNIVKYLGSFLLAALLLWWITSLMEIRDDAIDLKDTAAKTVLNNVRGELTRSQLQISELETSLTQRDAIIEKLNAVNGQLVDMRTVLEKDLARVSANKAELETALKRYTLNYTEEALNDVDTVEAVTNTTISDIMLEYEAITTDPAGNSTRDSRSN